MALSACRVHTGLSQHLLAMQAIVYFVSQTRKLRPGVIAVQSRLCSYNVEVCTDFKFSLNFWKSQFKFSLSFMVHSD